MRAQRAYRRLRDPTDVTASPSDRTHIVVAEPMPGDSALVEEFAASRPAVVGELFKEMVSEMRLAGELGTLLRVEEASRDR